MEDCLELLELQRLLKEGVEGIFPDKVWVRAEIGSISRKSNGHCYLELCQSDGQGVVAKAKAVIWRGNWYALSRYFEEVTGGPMREGMTILALVQVSYSELYGMTLTISEVEPQFTLGEAELQRRRTIEKLEADGAMEWQKKLTPAVLPRHLAVVSARDAAGFGDFCRHLAENEYGFAFSVELFEAAMQGADAPGSISDAIARVEEAVAGGASFDAVLILRGGGSALDLACFDDYGLCLAIAGCGIPVFTAIGHDRDYHVADMVAYGYVKTPTALADLFIEGLAAEDERIGAFATRLRMAFAAKVAAMDARLTLLESRIAAADPRRVLSRGYSLVTDGDGVVLKSAAGVEKGRKLRILFADGSLEVEVK